MKKMFKNLMLVAVAAMAFVGCNNDLISVDTLKKPTVITFNASMEDDTRTSMTDENSDGKYEVNWSANDQVAFVVYGDNDSIIEIQTATVAEDGASAELTVEFNSELTTGQRIVAYCNYGYYASENWNNVEPARLSYQTPKQNDVEKHYISAEYTYNGEAVAPLKFSHDYAYAKMVVESLEGIDTIEMTFNDNDTEKIYLDCYNVTNNIFMFTCPAMAVNKINVEVTIYDDNYQPVYYTFNKELADGKLTFKKGSIAKFTIKDWKSILEAPTNVQASDITPNSITFSWNAVADAQDYTYTVNGTTETTDKTSVVVTGLEPLTEYKITVVANPKNSETHATSKEVYAYATTSADRSVLDKEFTEVVEFANMTKLENYTNTYLFTTDGGGTTINDKFMYLKFNNEIDFSNSGEYSIDDLYSGDSECCIWVGREVADCRGYTDHYKLGFIPYHFYPNYGDTYIIYVDVVDGKSSITVYANNASYWSALKFKGVYVEKEALATPVLTSEINGNAITVNWEAIEGADNYTVTLNGTEYNTDQTSMLFEGLEYATNYYITVVANPKDASANKSSEAAELYVMTPEDPTPSISVDPTEVYFNCTNNYDKWVTVTVKNIEGDITATSDNEQFSVRIEGGSVVISAKDNSTSEVITGTITVSAGNLSTTISVTQEAMPATLELTSAVATHAASNMINGTGYDITFSDGKGTTIVYQVQTLDHTYLKEGQWDPYVSYSVEGYINSVSWPNVSYPWPYLMSVSVVDNEYDITLQVSDLNNGNKTSYAHFKGLIENFTLPETGGDEPGTGDDEGDSVVDIVCDKIGTPSTWGDVNIMNGADFIGNICINPLGGKSFTTASYTKADIDTNNSNLNYYLASKNIYNLNDAESIDISITTEDNGVTGTFVATIVIDNTTYNINWEGTFGL